MTRQTTLLLMDHLPKPWAELAESYILPIKQRDMYAAIAGHWELTDQLSRSKKGRNWALYGACQGDSIELVHHLLARGADDFNQGLVGAIIGGNIPAAELMLTHGADWNDEYEYFVPAQSGISMEMLERIAGKRALSDEDLSDVLMGGMTNDDMYIVNWAIARGNPSWDSGLHGACIGGHRRMIDLALAKGGHPNSGLRGACSSGRLGIAKEMIGLGATDLNQGLVDAMHDDSGEIVELMFAHGASPGGHALQCAHIWGRWDLVRMLIDRGATDCACGKTIAEHEEMYMAAGG